MRKWKCISGHGKDDFIVGNIYESNDEGYGLIGEDGFVYGSLRYDEFAGAKFEEVFEKDEEKKVNKFKVGDKVRIIGNKSSGHKFNIGEVAKIDKIYDEGTDSEHCMASNESKSYYVSYVDIELFNKSSTKSITITTSDSTTTLTDGIITVSVNRYHIDKHDEEVAVREVTDKYYEELAKIERVSKLPKVGDKVKVINNGRTHSIYDKWLIKNNVNLKSAIKWKIGLSPENGGEYVIKEIHKHEYYDADLALIEDAKNAYIINIKGLEVIK